MKLELKYLAFYFPYKLNCYGSSDIFEIIGLYPNKILLQNGVHILSTDYDDFIIDYSIILRPLSDLTKEIEVNGEKFIPINKLKMLDGEYYFVYDNNELFYDDNCGLALFEATRCNELFQKLFEWHFDVFNLIENNLAIDINTINQ